MAMARGARPARGGGSVTNWPLRSGGRRRPPRAPSRARDPSEREEAPNNTRGGGANNGRSGGRSGSNCKNAHDPPDEAPASSRMGSGGSNGRRSEQSRSNTKGRDPSDQLDEAPRMACNSGHDHSIRNVGRISSNTRNAHTNRGLSPPSSSCSNVGRSNKKAQDPSDNAPLIAPHNDGGRGSRRNGLTSGNTETRKVRGRGLSPPPSIISTTHRHRDDHYSEKSTDSHGGRNSDRVSGKTRKARSSPPRSFLAARNPYDDCDSERRSPLPPIQSVTRRPYHDPFNGGHCSVRSSGAPGNGRNARSNGRGSSRPSSTPAAAHHSHDDHYSDISANSSRGYLNVTSDRDNHDYPLLDTEEEQYAEYQEQLYQQSYSLSQSQSSQCQQQEEQQFSLTHRKFNLAPIYDDVEMASLHKEKGEHRNRTGDERQRKSKKKGTRPNGPCLGEEITKGTAIENYSQVLAFLESSDTENGSRRSAKRHEEFYNHDEEEDAEEDDGSDDDEERPLRESRSSGRPQDSRLPPKSVLSWSEMCLNRSLVLAFALVCFVFIRNRTPWWKEHERRATLQKHHHHHNIDNTDDDDLASSPRLDPMSIYNSNDDDSTHTRDHDPLGRYTEYTKDRGESDMKASNAKAAHDRPSSKYDQATAGKRISNHPPVKSLHHGFMDEDYADRPRAEHDGSNAAALAGVRTDNGEVDEEKAAFLESVMRSPTKKKVSNASDENGGEKGVVGEEEGDNLPELLPPPIFPPAKEEVPVQEVVGVHMQGSSNAANDGGRGKEESDNRQVISPPPVPPSANGEVLMQSTTGALPPPANNEVPMQSTTGVQPPSANNEVPMQSTTEVLPALAKNEVPMQSTTGVLPLPGASVAPLQSRAGTLPLPGNAEVPIQSTTGVTMQASAGGDMEDVTGESGPQDQSLASTDTTTGEAALNGFEPRANPQDTKPKELLWDGNEPAEMPWDGGEVGDTANTQATSSPNSGLAEPPPPSQSSPVVDALSSTQQKLGGSSNHEAFSNGSVSSANPQNTQAKEMPLNGNESDILPNSQTSANANGHNVPPPFKENTSQFSPIMNKALSGEEVKSVYKDSYYRWNHPLRPVAQGDPGKDVPVFWRIPRSASGTVESVMSFCYRNVLASSMGISAGHDQDQTLDVVTLGTGAQYVNVDMSRPDGIRRAKRMSLGSSGLADAISTPFLFEAADVFSDVPEAGKCFTLLRHPVDRAISLYHHYQIDESGNPNTAQYKGMSIDEFADKVAENNWMVRFLANKRSGALNWHDLEVAKEVFGRKCLVGLVDKAEESLRRYERFFRWDKKISHSDSKDQCLTQYLANGDKRKEHPTYEGTAAWEALRKKNEYDCLLYEFAEKLYTQQSSVYEKLS